MSDFSQKRLRHLQADIELHNSIKTFQSICSLYPDGQEMIEEARRQMIVAMEQAYRAKYEGLRAEGKF